jgi:hypothetical protein
VTGDPPESEPAPVLSIVIPVYNEVQTIGRILDEVAKALPETPKQIVIVDDGSSDGTSDWLRRNLGHSEGSWRRLLLNAGGDLQLSADGPSNHAEISFTLLFHERNRGKGAAVRTGLTSASGDVVVIRRPRIRSERLVAHASNNRRAEGGRRCLRIPFLWPAASFAVFPSLPRQSAHLGFIQFIIQSDVV